MRCKVVLASHSNVKRMLLLREKNIRLQRDQCEKQPKASTDPTHKNKKEKSHAKLSFFLFIPFPIGFGFRSGWSLLAENFLWQVIVEKILHRVLELRRKEPQDPIELSL